MPLIPTKHVELKETLSCRIEQAVHERLKLYATFIDSPKEYVVTQALDRLFRGDKEFAQWLATRPEGGGLSTDRLAERATGEPANRDGVASRRNGGRP
jgi:hypothetical protein